MLALFNLGGGKIILLLALVMILGLGALVVVGIVIFLIVRGRRKTETPMPPAAPGAKTPPPAEATQVMPHKCPKCGTELKADAPEGLCPACLLQRGLATEGGAAPGTPPFTPPLLAELAKLFPQLEILEVIGQGGMGAVYKARQPALDRFVALKILAPRSGGDLDFSGRFSREARALARLSHPNIVAVYDFGQIQPAVDVPAGSQPPASGSAPLSYFIMEYVDGPNLRQVEQAGKLTPREALQIIPQICAALQYAHDESIVHRDIKPENVLLDKKGRVKIADFGLAKILGQEADFRLTGARDVMGTPHYMAPEQVETPQEVDHRADIYSLGVVFYEMLTGELPLGKFDPPSHKVQIDVRLDDVVMRSLSKSPDRRYQHVSEVGTHLQTIAQNPSAPGAQAEISAFAQQAAARDYQLNIRSCLSRGWNLVKQNFWPVFGVNALVVILLAFMGSFSLTLSSNWPGAHIGSVLSLILSGPLLGGLYLYFLKLIRKERATVETVFSGFSNRFLQLLLGNIVATLLVGLGFVCLILPGIYLATAWLFTLVLIIDKRLDFWPAMELSRKVITKHWWKFFGFAIVLFLMKLTGFMFCVIGLFFAGPIVHAAFLYAYEDIFGANAGAGAKATAPVPPQTSRGSSGAGWAVAIGVGAIILIAILGLVAVVGITKKVKHRREDAHAEELLHRTQEEKARTMEAQRTDSNIDLVSGYPQNTAIEGFAMPGSRLVFSLGGQEVWNNSFSRKTAFIATLERADRGLRLKIVDLHDHTLMDVTERDRLDRANFNQGDISFVEGIVHPGPDGRLDDAGWCTLGYFQPENAADMPICVRLVGGEIESSDEDRATAARLADEGWQLWQERKLTAAAEKFRQSVQADPASTNGWNGLGWAKFNSGKTAEAQSAFQKALALDPNYSGSLNGLGQIYLSEGKYDDAERYLLKAAPQAPAAWYGLARLYLLQGNFEQAEKWAQKIVDSGQADDVARQMLQSAQEKHLNESLRAMIQPAALPGQPEVTNAVIHIRQFSAFHNSANVQYSAKLPGGYSMRATANTTGSANTYLVGDRYFASWFRGGSRSPSPAKPGEMPPPPLIMDSPEQMRQQGAILTVQLQELEDQGPVSIVFGEPKQMFSITNGDGEVWQGFLELVQAGANAPAQNSDQAPEPPRASVPPLAPSPPMLEMPQPPPPGVVRPLRSMPPTQSATSPQTPGTPNLSREEQIGLIEAQRLKFKQEGQPWGAQLLPPTQSMVDPITGRPSPVQPTPQNSN
ncbi:MAG TPA: protein kinase [Verrucomicrobiae bacterium]|jgi:serine/threonine protein kinase/tetratricopeptide (TPR) repeat protein|nr:protein kinase [Verrucomicrobiae bacterium]